MSELRAQHRLSASWYKESFRPERFLPIGLMLIGFGFSGATEDPFHAWRWTLLSFIAAAGLALTLPQGRGSAPAKPSFPSGLPAALVAGYLLFSVVSLFPAVNKAEGLWQLAQSAGWSAWFLLILRMGAIDAGFWTGVRRAAVASALLGSVFAAGQYWSLWAGEDGLGNGPGGLHGNRNLLASAQFLLSPWIVWALIADKGFPRIAACAAWIGFCYVLAIAQCRAVWVGCLVMAAVATTLHLRFGGDRARGGTSWRRAFPLLFALLLALPLAAAFLFHGAVKPGIDTRGGNLERAATVMDRDFDSNAQRLALWSKTLVLIGRNPIAGVGAGNWKIALPETGMAGLLWSDMEKVEVRPYNDWLWTFSEIGIPGGLCWLGLWVAGLFAGIRALRNSIAHPEGYPPALLITAAVSGFGVISFFDFPRERAEHMAWYAAGLAVLFAFSRRRDEVSGSKVISVERAGFRSMPNRFRPAFAANTALAASLSLACAATVVSGLRWKNEVTVHAAMNAHRLQDWPALIAACGRLDAWICDVNPASSPMAWQEGIARYQLGDVAGAERNFRDALRIHPSHTHALYDLSVCRLVAGDTAGAETLLRRTLDVSPGFPEAAINLAVLSLRRGDRVLARAALDGVGEARRDAKWKRLYRATALEERCSR